MANEFIDYYIENLSISMRQHLKKFLMNNGLACSSNSTTAFDNKNTKSDNVNNWLFSTKDENDRDFLKIFEKWEFFKKYKYSCIFEIIDFDKNQFDNKILDNAVQKIDNGNIKYNGFSDPIYCYNEIDDITFLKFVFNEKIINYRDDSIIYERYPIVLMIYEKFGILEIRFESISEFYFNSEKFYLENIEQTLNWFRKITQMNTKKIDLDIIIEKIRKENKHDVKSINQAMSMADGGKAQLDAMSKDNSVLPFLGEIKEMLRKHENEMLKAPNFKYEIEKYITDKEENSEYPWIVLRWVLGKKKVDVKFIFNYYNKPIDLMLHYSRPFSEMEVMNYVTKYIINNKTDIKE